MLLATFFVLLLYVSWTHNVEYVVSFCKWTSFVKIHIKNKNNILTDFPVKSFSLRPLFRFSINYQKIIKKKKKTIFVSFFFFTPLN